MKLICIGCEKEPKDIPEYIEEAAALNISPDDYVRKEEGTYNPTNGHFLCTECYIKAGLPSTPDGYTAP